jgi:cleavage and polyadenylation specificity factor subunit 5
MRRTCEGVLVCHEHNHPHVLMLQIANAFFKLYARLLFLSSWYARILANQQPVVLHRPGDYLQHDDDEVEGFKARLNERLAPVGSQFSGEGVNDDWEIGDTLAQWWRPNFETFMYPFLPGHVTRPKECKKLYFIQLPKKSASNTIVCEIRRKLIVAFTDSYCRGSFRTKEHEAPRSSPFRII